MDSTAYAYAIAEIQERIGKSCPHLPILFLQPPSANSPEFFDTVSFFCETLAGAVHTRDDKFDTWAQPQCMLENQDGVIVQSLITMHLSIAKLLQNRSEDVVPTAERRNYTEVFTLLVNAAHPRRYWPFPHTDSVGFAMAVFLLEAGMHAGWCPNTFETNAKQAAHTYFLHLKKNLYAASTEQLASILAYMYCAWLMAQRTEGIKDAALKYQSQIFSQQYTLWQEKRTSHYSLLQFPYSPELITIAYGPQSPTSVFRTINCENLAALRLWCGKSLVLPEETVETTVLNRPKTTGIRVVSRCRLPEGELRWLTVIQVYMNTIFRTDALRPVATSCNISHIQFAVENNVPLRRTATAQVYSGAAHGGIIVEVVENPLSLAYVRQEDPGVSLFESHDISITPGQTVQQTIAWRYGQMLTAIEHTNLLGIFDI